MNRTMEYENHLERIQKMRNDAIDAKTASRAFGDYAEILKNLPTLGAIADGARNALIAFAAERAVVMRERHDTYIDMADRLEAQGLGS